MMSIFGGVGGGCCSVINLSNFRKPLSSISILCSVLASLAQESITACSNAAKRSLSELGTCCCARFMIKGRTEGEFQMEEFRRASTGRRWSPDQVCQGTTGVVNLKMIRARDKEKSMEDPLIPQMGVVVERRTQWEGNLKPSLFQRWGYSIHHLSSIYYKCGSESN